MSYKDSSDWNEKNELRCLLIFKKLECENFPRGKQAEYCREMEKATNLSSGNISAKICNYKSVSGRNSASNYSSNTKKIFEKYSNCAVGDLEEIITQM